LPSLSPPNPNHTPSAASEKSFSSSSGVHSESGSYSVDRWLEIYAGHCHDHADQIRTARGSAAAAAVG